MKKRLLSLLLALSLPLGVAGCRQPPADPAADSSSAQTEVEPIPEPVQPDPAEVYVESLTLEQQVAQMFFARCPDVDAAGLAAQYDTGGYILFGRDFEAQTPDSVRNTIASYQQAAATPMLIGVDEEGGTVVRASAFPNFRASRFPSPQALFAQGGLERIASDAAEKDALLLSLGINVNLAPVCDVSTNPADFIYARAFGQDAAATSEYVRTVVEQMDADGMGMVLKHFPGYGSNADTHTGIAQDNRPIEQFHSSDFLPFAAGIESGAQAVLVCHNIVSCMDDTLPASLSPAVHEILRDELGFDGVVMTDDLVMEAITDYTGDANAAVLAVQAGNDMLISSDFVTQYNAVLSAVQSGAISADTIRIAAERVIRWKIELGLITT